MLLIAVVTCVLLIAAIGFVIGRHRAVSLARGGAQKLHSLPNYYGFYVVVLTLVPSFLLLVVWLAVQPFVLESQTYGQLQEHTVEEYGTRGLAFSEVKRLADGLDIAVERGAMTAEGAASVRAELTDIRDRLGEVGVALGSNVSADVLYVAQHYRTLNATGTLARTIAVLIVALAGAGLALYQTRPEFRARIAVERAALALLVAAASIAILTTVGIALSLIFNTIEFFRIYPIQDFLFGLVWQPSFTSESQSPLGIVPLIWGTLYISFIALLVAVPIGLFAAVYLSEYASSTVRSIAKPLLEVLAGIPTIVYGLFALLTVGPLLVSVFGRGGALGVDWMQGGTAVMTAGLVMGIMLIPFVSSLSDDIINAVPQSMRDGSLGLGATQSETVRKVILPAALPGIVGAILLAASRAIGETMIVVMGAGAAGRLSLNPFEAMTTVTAKIVSQLTGDADFTSPVALVAFALGMTLFVFTLGLNVLALYIVRKYREQYE